MRLGTTAQLSPLAVTLRRLADVEGDGCRLQLGGESGARWLELDGVLDGGLEILFAEVAAHSHGRRDYAGAAVARALSDALVTAGWPAVLLDRRLPDLSPANLRVRRHDGAARFDRIAFRRPHCLVLVADDAADHEEVETLTDSAAMHRHLAVAIVAAAGPWFDATRARAPFGRAGMWGQLADDVCGTALSTARKAGLDQRAAWDEANLVVDLIADSVPELRGRPRLFPVRWRGSETLFQVRGTCCLWYRRQERCDDGGAYCTTCPLRADEDRRERLASWLEEAAAR